MKGNILLVLCIIIVLFASLLDMGYLKYFKSDTVKNFSDSKSVCRDYLKNRYKDDSSLDIKWFSGSSVSKHDNGRTTVRMNFDLQQKNYTAYCLVSKIGTIIEVKYDSQ